MKKSWKRPSCTTLRAEQISSYIKAAAWSEGGICSLFVLR